MTQILALFLTAAPALAQGPTTNATGGAPMQIMIRPLTPEEAKNPEIAQPKDPGIDCISGVSTGEAGEIKEKSGITNLGKSCLPQLDAFKRNAEAASYLAIYQQNLSDYGRKIATEETRVRIQANIKACLEGDPACNNKIGDEAAQQGANRMRGDLLQALIQYNFGKDLRSVMLQSQTRAENMKTFDLPPAELKALGWQGKRLLTRNGSLHAAPVRDSTFKLDPSKIVAFEPDKMSSAERTKLGVEFSQVFNSFVDEYVSSTGQKGPKSKWSYVSAKTAAVGGGQVWVAQVDPKNLDAVEGKTLINKGRLNLDIKTQNSAAVEDIVKGFRENYKDVLSNPTTTQKVKTTDPSDPKKTKVTEKTVDSMKAAFSDAGFGLDHDQLAQIGTGDNQPRDEHDVAVGVALSINKVLLDKENELKKNSENQRFLSSASSNPGTAKPNIVPSVTVDAAAFESFLDAIWPTGEQRAQQQQQQATQ